MNFPETYLQVHSKILIRRLGKILHRRVVLYLYFQEEFMQVALPPKKLGHRSKVVKIEKSIFFT